MSIPQGYRVIVAGGATGIGAALCKRLAKAGAKVVVGDINIEGAKKTVADITAAGGSATALPFDLADDASCKALIDDGVKYLGGGVDALANVAAAVHHSFLGRDKTVADNDSDFFLQTYNYNLVGHARTMRYVLPYMLAEKSGAIVNVSSAAAHVGESERVAYGTSKAAVNALTRHASSAYYKKGVRTNGVAPGAIWTETMEAWAGDSAAIQENVKQSPVGRLGKPDEVAAVIAFLLSPDSSYCSGQVWSVNGGGGFRD